MPALKRSEPYSSSELLVALLAEDLGLGERRVARVDDDVDSQ